MMASDWTQYRESSSLPPSLRVEKLTVGIAVENTQTRSKPHGPSPARKFSVAIACLLGWALARTTRPLGMSTSSSSMTISKELLA